MVNVVRESNGSGGTERRSEDALAGLAKLEDLIDTTEGEVGVLSVHPEHACGPVSTLAHTTRRVEGADASPPVAAGSRISNFLIVSEDLKRPARRSEVVLH
jgi:hypothetical protein